MHIESDCYPGGNCPVCNAEPEPICFYCDCDGIEGDYLWIEMVEKFVCKECQEEGE